MKKIADVNIKITSGLCIFQRLAEKSDKTQIPNPFP
jgi:hypothetical protein